MHADRNRILLLMRILTKWTVCRVRSSWRSGLVHLELIMSASGDVRIDAVVSLPDWEP